MSRLLCVGFYRYDVEPLVTIARHAQERLGLEPVFLSLAPAEAAADLRAQVEAAGFDTIDRKVTADEDRSLRHAVPRYRAQRAATVRLTDDLLDDVRPDAIVASVNVPPGYFLDEAARRGVPTILLQLFFWGDRSYYRDLWADDRRHYDALLSTRRRLQRRYERRVAKFYGVGPNIPWTLQHAKIAVQGPGLRRRLLAEGVPGDNVVVTGNPVLDELHRLRLAPHDSRVRVRDQLGLAEGTRIVSHMRSHEDRLLGLSKKDREQSQIDIIRAVQRGAPEAQIVVKIHPKEGDAEKALVRSIDAGVLVVGEEVATDDLLAASDAVIGSLSTTLLYAVLLDRPTISAWLWPGLEYWRRSTEWSGVDRADTADALAEAVRRHVSDPAYQEEWRARRDAFVAEEFLFDGESTKHVVDLIERLRSAPSRAAAGRRT